MLNLCKTVAFVAVLSYVAFADNFSAWNKSALLQINTTASWANVSGTVLNFPVLVSLDSAVFNFSETKAAGADVRFAKADGTTALPFEIESWDGAAGRAAIWVLVDTIRGTSSRQIKMFWGNTAAASASKSTAVFDSLKGYLGVWHLNDAVNSATNVDATGRGADGQKMPAAGAIPSAETPLGIGQLYNATTAFNYTEIPAGKVDLKNKNITISAWIKRKSTGAGDYFIAQGTKDPSVGLRFGFDYQSKFTFNFLEGVGVDVYTKPITTKMFDWHYWVGTFDNSTKKISIYCDGKLDTSGTVTLPFTGNDKLTFAWAYGLSGEYLHASGSLDEPRAASLVRSADWIALEYANQKQGQTLVGNPVPTAACTQNFGVNQTTLSINEGATATLIGRAKCSDRYQWVQVDGTTETPILSKGVILQPATRVHGTTTVKYRFKALYGTSWQSADVNLSITEAIPEPEFTLIAPATFNSLDPLNPLIVSPLISNLAAVRASSSPTISYKWTVSGMSNFNMVNEPAGDTLSIYPTSPEGDVTVSLCVDNGGAPICKEATIHVSSTGVVGRGGLKGKGNFSIQMVGKVLIAQVPQSKGEIKLFSTSGALVFKKQIAGNGTRMVALPALAKGTYVVTLQAGSLVARSQVFVQ